MEGRQKAVPAEPKAIEAAICEECKENPSKYRCPGCSIRSCSLPCVKAHKQRTGCTGKRNVTQFVPLSQFNDNLLLSDYHMLEEAKRVAESAQRMRAKLCGFPHFRLPFYLRSLRSAAASRRIKLMFLPSGMSRREKNQTRYDQRKKFISWTIEWRFHSTSVVILDHGVREDASLCSIIKNHLKPGPWNHPLRQFCNVQLKSLKLFIRKYPKGPKSPFLELDISSPIRQQLANVVLLEYPVIHVFLPSHSYDFKFVKDVHPMSSRSGQKDSVNEGYQKAKGVIFREEEIEEDICSSEPQVLDLMKQAHSNPVPQVSQENRSETALNNLSDSVLVPRMVAAAGDISHSGTNNKEPGVIEDMDFDFDQGLIDAYSDLIAEINPDDFLDLEGDFLKELEMEEREDFSNLRGAFSAEELEEGEIAE